MGEMNMRYVIKNVFLICLSYLDTSFRCCSPTSMSSCETPEVRTEERE